MRYPIIAGLLFSAWVWAAPVETLQSGEWGDYAFHRPDGDFHGLVFLFSPARGVATEDQSAARELASRGWAVALVDSGVYLHRVGQADPAERHGDCLYLPGAVEWTSQFLQHRLGVGTYRPPFLAGREQGGALVYALLSQSHPGSFAAGLSRDFPLYLAANSILCERPAAGLSREGQTLAPDAPLGAEWFLAAGGAFPADVSAFAEKAGHANAGRVRFIEPGPGYSDSITMALSRFSNIARPKDELGDLPLVEVSQVSGQGVLAIIYSGDGGWRDIDKTLGDYLAKQDVAVLGVDALRYFWKKQTPDQIGQDLTRILAHYLDAWKLREVWLIGYSFGADVLPFAYNRLPESLRSRVVQVSLLSPGLSTDFEMHVSGWLGGGPGAGALPIAPEFTRVPVGKVQCIYGAKEAEESLCVKGAPSGLEVVKISGGHHFDGDYVALGRRLLVGLRQRLATEAHKNQ